MVRLWDTRKVHSTLGRLGQHRAGCHPWGAETVWAGFQPTPEVLKRACWLGTAFINMSINCNLWGTGSTETTHLQKNKLPFFAFWLLCKTAFFPPQKVKSTCYISAMQVLLKIHTYREFYSSFMLSSGAEHGPVTTCACFLLKQLS